MFPQTGVSDPFSGRNEAICRLGGLEDLYNKSIERFRENYIGSGETLSTFFHQRQYEHLKVFSHSVKGLAATLGMDDLCSCCQRIEQTITEGRYNDLPYLIKSYNYALSQVIHSRTCQSSSAPGTGFSGLK